MLWIQSEMSCFSRNLEMKENEQRGITPLKGIVCQKYPKKKGTPALSITADDYLWTTLAHYTCRISLPSMYTVRIEKECRF